MPNIKKIIPSTRRFLENPELTVFMEFSEQELNQNFLIKISYILLNRSLKKEVVGNGIFYEGVILPEKELFEEVFKKGSKIIKPGAFIDMYFQITIQPIFISDEFKLM